MLAARAERRTLRRRADPFLLGRARRLAADAALQRARPVPWLGNVRPFLVPNVEMLRSDGPNPLTSDAYAKDFNEVKELGSLTSTTRTAGADRWRDLLAGAVLRLQRRRARLSASTD